MATHSFEVGERVSLESTMRRSADRADVFVVKTRLPHVGSELQYRVKTEGEPYDRVVTEGQLTRIGSSAAEQVTTGG